jgi:HK97 family phage prohead protease
MTKTLAPKRWHITDATLEVRTESDLPAGVAGRVSGIALTYEVVDSYDTMFARGAAKRSIDTRVAARKLPLLMDHERSTRAHVGVVTGMSDIGDALLMTADIFDTAEGRSALEYVKAVLASGASTGFSIGFIPRRSEQVMSEGRNIERFTEIELREVSVTPMPAVPGAEVQAARHEEEAVEERSDEEILTMAARAALDALPSAVRDAIIATYADAARLAPAPDSPDSGTRSSDAPDAPRVATMDERLRAVRQSYAPHNHK